MSAPRVWTVSLAGRLTMLAVVAVFVFIAFADGDQVKGILVLVALGVVTWLAVVWPAVILTDTEVVVRNPWGVRRIPLSDVESAGAGYSGLTIRRHSGGSVTAWALQKSNAAKWTNRTTRADEAAAAIQAAADRAAEPTP
ncbi:hypothetical protein OHA21_08795 [Actinoplanes sp. NBC_00393]|uniref:PH domain-containing protein n=1 Tax=Actinoplanes sp. NBC_00393 TaxID=2975953 RepID=UPI002E22CBB3